MSINGPRANPSPPAGSTSPPRFNVTVTMLGAVCGAVVPACLTALDAPTADRLFGLIVGAALPPFVSTIGRWRRIRVGLALLLASISLVVAYGGLTAGAVAIAAEPPLPVPPFVKTRIVPPPPPTTTPPPPTSPRVARTYAGIVVNPSKVTCGTTGCGKVTVTSSGTGALKIGRIEFSGASAKSASASGCQKTKLDPGDQCASRSTHIVSGS